MAKSKFFRAAVEGATTDGRVIERSWIADMAELYSQDTYGARVNLEHFRGILADGPFRSYGDVVGAQSHEITDGALKGKLALFVQVDPTPDLVKLSKARQKVYPSIEVNPKFADTGRAYLVGLAITDSPASLGTEMLTFAAKHPDVNPLAARKQDPGNLFTAATDAVVIELEDEPAAADTAGLFARILSKLESIGRSEPAKPDPKTAAAAPAEFTAAVSALTGVTRELAQVGQRTAYGLAALQSDFAALKTAHATTAAALATLHATLDTTPGTHTPRPPATGGDGAVATDC